MEDIAIRINTALTWKMKGLAFTWIALLALVCHGHGQAKAMERLGGGATFPYPLYSKMFYTDWKATGVKVNYQAIVSGGGQRQIINLTDASGRAKRGLIHSNAVAPEGDHSGALLLYLQGTTRGRASGI
jgi:hypothetical protein